jgi:hypothetical protein
LTNENKNSKMFKLAAFLLLAHGAMSQDVDRELAMMNATDMMGNMTNATYVEEWTCTTDMYFLNKKGLCKPCAANCAGNCNIEAPTFEVFEDTNCTTLIEVMMGGGGDPEMGEAGGPPAPGGPGAEGGEAPAGLPAGDECMRGFFFLAKDGVTCKGCTCAVAACDPTSNKWQGVYIDDVCTAMAGEGDTPIPEPTEPPAPLPPGDECSTGFFFLTKDGVTCKPCTCAIASCDPTSNKFSQVFTTDTCTEVAVARSGSETVVKESMSEEMDPVMSGATTLTMVASILSLPLMFL